MLGHLYCGDSLPASQISSSNHLFIHFRSDESGTGTGFKLEYNATSKHYVLRARKRTKKFGESGNLLLYFSQKPKLKLTTTKKFDR